MNKSTVAEAIEVLQDTQRRLFELMQKAWNDDDGYGKLLAAFNRVSEELREFKKHR